MKSQEEITEEQRSVLEIKFENGDKIYLAAASYCAVANPKSATRYPPLADDSPERAKRREQDINWMRGSYEAEFAFIPFLEACKEYNKLLETLSP